MTKELWIDFQHDQQIFLPPKASKLALG